MLSDDQIKLILIQEKVLSEKEYNTYQKQAEDVNTTLLNFLESKKILTEQQFYQTVASYYKLPFIDIKNRTIRKDILFLIPEPIAQSHKIVAFDKTETSLKIAALDPKDLEIFEFLGKKTGLRVEIYITTAEGINAVLKTYHKGLQAEFSGFESSEKAEDEKEEKDKNLQELAQDLPVISIVDTLLEYAIYEGASDIHIEPSEKELNIRYRID